MKNSRTAIILLVLGVLWLAGCASEPRPAPLAEAPHKKATAAWVTTHILPSNANIARSLADGYLVSLQSDDLAEGELAQLHAMAARMGIPAPALYIDTTDRKSAPEAEARFTREGASYIVMNQRALEKWTTDQRIAVFGHELVHLKEKHVTAKNIATAYNNPEISIAHELEADEVGSGPLGSCDPQALKEALKIVTETDMGDYLVKHPSQTSEDYNALVGTDHPLWDARAAKLDALAQNPSEECINRGN